ncbi:Hypothetical protein FKW44_015682 [Caligus rogercresseyi]|uniref:Uncharacterized protein n=1 Tax=Caligus rogercresseyi TaxID=217165 RepID=A0A7T8H0S9_CALRO|nr:Hypothetical protein FKW44_015682 [Caligus rogercresseyi]
MEPRHPLYISGTFRTLSSYYWNLAFFVLLTYGASPSSHLPTSYRLYRLRCINRLAVIPAV